MSRASLARLALALPLACASCGLLAPSPPSYAPVRLDDGLIVQDRVAPEAGPRAKDGDTVTIHVEGRLENGTVFESSYANGTPITFELGAGAVPAGLDRGLVGLRLKGRRSLVVPSELGYGAAGVPGVVPPHATLWFEVELLALEPPAPRAPVDDAADADAADAP